MKTRQYKPECEQLEGRALPRVSSWQPPVLPEEIVRERPLESRSLLESVPAQVETPGYAVRFTLAPEAEVWDPLVYPIWESLGNKRVRSEGSVLAGENGLRYLLNYANKSIRNSKFVHENDRADMLQEIYIEWRKGVGHDDLALSNLLNSESVERGVLRESVYRVFGRYRYHLKMTHPQTLGEIDPPSPRRASAEECRDFSLDLREWMGSLPRLEQKVIQLYYFENMTMEKIGTEIGLPKQRISEIHRRALEKHPDYVAPEEVAFDDSGCANDLQAQG